MPLSNRRWSLYCPGFIASVLLAGVALGETIPDHLTAAQMREDLTYLRDVWAHQDRSFDAAGQVRFAHELADVSTRVDRLTPPEFSLEIARLVAIGANGHSVARLPAMPGLPIRVWRFDDGLFIVSAHPQHADLVGMKIVRIGATPADEAMRRVAVFIPGNDEHQRIEAPRFLTNPLALERATVIASSAKVTLTVSDSGGRERKVSLDTRLTVEPLGPDTWEMLIPAEAGTPDRWPHVLDDIEPRLRAFGPANDLSYDWISSEPRVLYLRSTQIDSDDDVRLDMKLLELTANELVPQPAHSVIVDLRYNMGGNLYNTILFTQMLPKLVSPEGKILVLTGPVTFSAALVTASMLKMHGGARVQFVGDHMGDHDRFWAEGRNLELPHSRIRVRYSDGYHDWSGPCRIETCLWATRIFGPGEPISLQPDVHASMNFSDYSRGVDAALDEALRLAR